MDEARQFPAQSERVETGAIQFGGDWPGVFLRGDNAIAAAYYLGEVFDAIERGEDPRRIPVSYEQAKAVKDLLSCCDTDHLDPPPNEANQRLAAVYIRPRFAT